MLNLPPRRCRAPPPRLAWNDVEQPSRAVGTHGGRRVKPAPRGGARCATESMCGGRRASQSGMAIAGESPHRAGESLTRRTHVCACVPQVNDIVTRMNVMR
eukprot:7002678-Prymnesium_polylepis.1